MYIMYSSPPGLGTPIILQGIPPKLSGFDLIDVLGLVYEVFGAKVPGYKDGVCVCECFVCCIYSKSVCGP